MKSRFGLFPIIMLIVAVAMVGFGTWQMNKMPSSKFPQFGQPEFTLQHGDKPVKFSDFAGKVSIVFFGYTHCPDVCPATLLNFSKALKMLSDEERAKVRAIFVAIDVARDTPEKVKKYTEFFHPEIVGLGGSEAQMAVAAKAFKVPFEKDKVNKKGNYLMNHGTYMYVMRPDGKLGNLESHKSSPEQIAEYFRRWIKWAE